MKSVIKNVYYCEFCNKQYFSKHHGQRHEDSCAKRPENVNPCLQCCKHLETVKSEVCFDSYPAGIYQEECFEADCFRCKKKDVLMFPYTAERLNKKYDLEANGQEPMPKISCEFFEENNLF